MVRRPLPPAFECEHLPELLSNAARIAGVDEVGRGALFGPVVAAAVILPRTAIAPLVQAGVRDSKQLSPARRADFAQQIQALALDVKVGYATAAEIDQINIFQASLWAMQRAVNKLEPPPDLCLVDGRFSLPDLKMPQQNLVKGDRQSLVIAAASIVAKVWRDDLVVRWATKYPDYDLAANKGYGTERHRLALQRYGPSPQHRRSFRPCQGADPRFGTHRDRPRAHDAVAQPPGDEGLRTPPP